MSKRKWGESFLKSGLPLEHTVALTFKSLGWRYTAHLEYLRKNQSEIDEWFELDLLAEWPNPNRDTYLSFLVECKYHDESRFWMFLPHDPRRWHFDARIFNCGPFQTIEKELHNDPGKNILSLAPASVWGVVVAQDGTKQDNAVHTAIEQIVNGFVPICLNEKFWWLLQAGFRKGREKKFKPTTKATIPMIVTNARIFRINPLIGDLEKIRNANSPDEVADEIGWTWCYFDPSRKLIERNLSIIKEHATKYPDLIYRYPEVRKRMNEFSTGPNWICIVNLKSLELAVQSMTDYFESLTTSNINIPHPEEGEKEEE